MLWFLKNMIESIKESSVFNRWKIILKEKGLFYLICILIFLYLYGIVINSFIGAMQNFRMGTTGVTFSLNPIKCLKAVFTAQGLGVAFFICIMYVLIAGKWMYLITGVKITKDERNFDVTNEGSHGTSGWMTKKDMKRVLLSDTADGLPCPILCKIKKNAADDDRFAEYLRLRDDCGLNRHILIYGATGSGKSRGFVKPFIQKMVQLKVNDKKSKV